MTAVEHADDNLLSTFLGAMNAYRDQHRHDEPVTTLIRNAQLAGVRAAVAEWERHPGDGEATYPGHLAITDPAEKDRLKAQGWTCLGYSTFYFLAPPAPVDGGP